MLDENGLRLNVGIILSNQAGSVFWARRIGSKDAWQFPQGGMRVNETPQQAMYRELYEEIGLKSQDVTLVAESRQWLSYYLPEYLRRPQQPVCLGQRQKWFLLSLLAEEKTINFSQGEKAEFNQWRWVDYWHPVQQVVNFKKNVYQRALHEFSPYMEVNTC